MRKTLKVLHTLAACGLIGGLLSYMALLILAPQETPAAYADLRASISGLSNYILIPSLALALVAGLLSMVVHRPFLEAKRAWLKAAMGILMFKGVLTIVGAKANYAAAVSRDVANGAAEAAVLEAALAQEWYTLGAVMLLSVANVVLGIWRPRLRGARQPRLRSAPVAQPQPQGAPDAEERTRPAA